MLQKKLLSITSMTEKGAIVKFEDDTCTLLMNSKSYSFGRRYGKLWRLNSVDVHCNYGCSAEKTLELWHYRLGHLNFNDLNMLIKNGMVKGLTLDIDAKTANGVCESCIVGKQAKDKKRQK